MYMPGLNTALSYLLSDRNKGSSDPQQQSQSFGPFAPMQSWFTNRPMLPQQLAQQAPQQSQGVRSLRPIRETPMQSPWMTQSPFGQGAFGNPQFQSAIAQILSLFGGG